MTQGSGLSSEGQGSVGRGGQKTQRVTRSSGDQHAIFLVVTPGHRCINLFSHPFIPAYLLATKTRSLSLVRLRVVCIIYEELTFLGRVGELSGKASHRR